MIEFRLSPAALGNTRFGYSPLGELASSLRALNAPAGPLLRPWLRHAGPQLRSVDLELLRALAPAGNLAPDFMFAWSPDPHVTIEEQLDTLLAVPSARIAHDLAATWAGRRPPPALARLLDDGGRAALAQALMAYWDVAVRPFWRRIRSTIDDDIAYRGNRLLAGGLYELLGDLHPEVSLRDDVMIIDKPHHADESHESPSVTLIPSVFVWPQLLIAHSAPNCFELQYAARGVGRVWEGLSAPDSGDDALAALLGRTRASILVKLATPHSTTDLARILAQSPGSVSAHLSVLRRNGLVSATRKGRSVMYRRTALATTVLAAGDGRDLREEPA